MIVKLYTDLCLNVQILLHVYHSAVLSLSHVQKIWALVFDQPVQKQFPQSHRVQRTVKIQLVTTVAGKMECRIWKK